MILGVGVDCMETGRVERELSRGKWLPEDGIFTAEEIVECSRDRNPAQSFAGCFAAKEATMKALGVRVDDLRMFREVEIRKRAGQQYRVVLHGRLKTESSEMGVRSVRLSIARGAGNANATVVLED